MLKLQTFLLAIGLGLFSFLYFGLDVKPKKAALLIALEREIEATTSDSLKSELLKQLSGKWFEYKQPHIAGFYAEQVAEMENTVEAWSITGTSFAATFKGPFEEKVKTYSLDRAVTAFENAISINPEDVRSKVNLALCYVERPPEQNPMKGILMLLDYDKQYPDNPVVLSNLGRLAIQTGQYEKAIGRLERVISISPENIQSYCLLAVAYEKTGNREKAALYQAKCR